MKLLSLLSFFFSRNWTLRRGEQPVILRYLISIVAVGMALAGMLAMYPSSKSTPFILFFAAVTFSCWNGGSGPGLFSIALSALLSDYFFLEPTGSVIPTKATGWLQLALFVVVNLTLCALIEATQRASSEARQELERRAQAEAEQAQLAAQLSVERKRLDDLLSSVPGVVWEAWGEPDAASQRINYVSRYVETMLGYTVEEWESTPNFWLTIVHPDDREAAAKRAHQSFASGKGGSNEFRWIRKDGGVIWAEAQDVIIKDEEGSPVGMRGVTMDVTERHHIREELRQREQWLAATLMSIGDAVIATDAGGRVSFMNPVAERLTGWADAEARDHPVREVFHIVNESTRAEVESPVEKVLRTGAVVGLANHTCLLSRDGTETAIDDSGAPIRGVDGAITGVVLVFRDITERRRAEEKLRVATERAGDILESITDAFAAYDRDWSFVYVNRPTEELVGKSREELIGRNLWEVMPQLRATTVEEQLLRTMRDRVPAKFDVEEAESGTWLEIRVYPTREGISVYATDISSRKRAEAALQKHQANVERLNDRLRRAMTETHHRVKNNLQIMAAFVDMKAMESDGAVSSEELQHLVSQIRTLAAVHDILTAEAKENGTVDRVSSRAVLEKLIALLQVATAGRVLEVDLADTPLPIRQGTSLALVTNELVSNAVKYGRELVGVKLSRSDGAIFLEVYDDGPGLPPRFNVDRDANTGLDLVKNLTQWDLGGELRFANRPEGGACVTITVPVDEEAPRTAGAAAEPAASPR